MSTAPTETSRSSPSGSVRSLENLLFDYPEADVILRSRDSYEFCVLKLYIVHSSPILGDKLLLSPNPQLEPAASAIPAESNEEGTAVNVPCVVQLPVDGAILLSLLSYIFPVQSILPSTEEQTMELLSVAQMYKMDVVLTHIRNHIAQQEPPFIREETAFLIYSLAQKHCLRTEVLQAARCTLSFSSLTIEDLAEEDKLDLMPGAFLHELWKYHRRVRSNLTSDLEGFRSSDAPTILGDVGCDVPTNSGVPYWVDSYISDIATTRVPVFLDLADFLMRLAGHIQDLSSNKGCPSCSSIPQKKIRAFWEALTATVQGSISKAELDFVLPLEETRSECQARRTYEATSSPKYSDMPNADVILLSSDLTQFRVNKLVLVTSSPFFADMFSLPQPLNDAAPDDLPMVHLPEDAEVLNSLFSMLYPVTPEMPHSSDGILALLATAAKYDMDVVQTLIRAEISRRGLFSSAGVGVFRVYAVACSKGLIPEVETAARLTLGHPLTFESLGDALQVFEGRALRDLADFRLRSIRNFSSNWRLFSDCLNGPSNIWVDCPTGHVDGVTRLPTWLQDCLWSKMVDQQPPPGSTLTLGNKANPPSKKHPPEPPKPPPLPQNSTAHGTENQNRNMQMAAVCKTQERAHIASLDEAHAPFKYTTRGNFDYNGTFSDVEDPKQLFINSAKLIIATLQGGLQAPSIPTPNLLGAADWADLSCALLAAIGRGYSLQYDKDQADTALRREWAEAPDPNPLNTRYPTLFHRLSATADALNDQLLIDGQDDECSIEGWILEAKTAILKEETKNIKVKVQEECLLWRTEQIKTRAAAQERDIADAVQKRNTSYLLKAAAQLGLHLAPPPLQNPQGLPSGTPRGVKRTVSGSAPSTEPTTPRKQKVNPPQDAKRAPSPAATPRGRPADPTSTAGPPRWVDPSPTPQPRKKEPPIPQAVLNLSPKVTLNLGPKVSMLPAVSTGQLDAGTIIAAIQAAMAPITVRLTALERAAMPPPAARERPRLGDQTDQPHRPDAPQASLPNPVTQQEIDFTVVTRTGKGRKGKSRTNAPGPEPEQPRKTNLTPASYAGAAAAATNIPQPPLQKKGDHHPPTVTEVTVLREGGLMDPQKETQIQSRAADALVREVRLKMAKATANPIRLRAGRWSINPRSKGNFVFSFDGNVPFDVIKSYEHILLAPLGSIGKLCPSMGWTRFLANGVPVWEEDNYTAFSPDALLEEVRALPGLKKAYFAMQPRWLIHPDRIYTDYSSVTFAVSDPDGSIASTLISSRAALFGKEVSIRKWIDKPAFIQCSRCHTLGHNKASKSCTLSKESIRCHKCGGAHPSEEHDKLCPKKHQVAGICDCKHKCLNCRNYGHDCKDPRCPARDQFRPRNARKPRKGKAKAKPVEMENYPYEPENNYWEQEEDWNDEIPGHPFSNLVYDTPPPPTAPPAPTRPAATSPQVPATTIAPAPTLTSPAGSQIMNIDYENTDPFTNRPAIYDDPFAGGEAPAPATYSPSHPQDGATHLARD